MKCEHNRRDMIREDAGEIHGGAKRRRRSSLGKLVINLAVRKEEAAG